VIGYEAANISDPASKVGVAISKIFIVRVSLWVHYCKRDEVYCTLQHCCDKTMNGKMALLYIANAVFRIVQNHGEQSNFRRF